MSEIRMLLDEIRDLKRRLQALETRQEHPGFAASDMARKSLTLAQFAATTSAQLAGVLSDETGSGGGFVRATSPTLVTPALGTPTALVGTNITGTAAGLTAGNVTTNANLTGPITSVGNATAIASQTGTGTKFVVDTSPTLVTPVLGAASATSLAVPAITTASGALTVTPAAGSGVALALSTTGDFVVNTSQFVVDTSAARVGVGTATPGGLFEVYNTSTSYTRSLGGTLQVVSANASTPVFSITGSSSADLVNIIDGSTEVFTILDGGNVGIGTTAPGTKLMLQDDGGSTSIRIRNFLTGDLADQYSQITGGRVSNGNSFLGFYTTTGGTAGEKVRIDNAGNLGIGTTAPTNLLSIGGNAARIVWMERHTTANTAGNTLTIQAGGATVSATDKAGGDLLLKPGDSTGSAESGVQIFGVVAGASGTADRTQTKAIQVLGNKLGFYAVTPVVRPTALTAALTALTHTAPGTPDYALQDLTAGGYGFVTADEGNTMLTVLVRTALRVGELETKLQALGLLT